jgi:hypothetical protein
MAALTEWLHLMLAEIARKREEAERERAEEAQRTNEQKTNEPQERKRGTSPL